MKFDGHDGQDDFPHGTRHLPPLLPFLPDEEGKFIWIHVSQKPCRHSLNALNQNGGFSSPLV